MDFFEHQEIARRRTTQMVVLYGLAVVLIVLAIYIAATFIFAYALSHGKVPDKMPLWNPQLFLWVTVSTLAVIVIGTLYKIHALSEGGRIVAELFGAVPVEPGTKDADERRLLNVVEEISLASGTRVPNVYVLEDEQSINAFAAGYTAADAVICVSQGCLDKLNRDELQGVIAHEFSHISNGDMRLNIRLIGVLNGILIIAFIGYGLIRIVFGGRRGVSVSRGGKKGGGGAILLVILAAGLALMAIGYIGVFFGRLIKSAVSRQREFLADASAVQFTRNPEGIGGALLKILKLDVGSRIVNSHAEEASHLFFANGLRGSWFSLMATHPPLEERIRQIDPSLFTKPLAKVEKAVGREGVAPGLDETRAAAAFAGSRPAGGSFAMQPGHVVSQVGAPHAGHLDYAAGLIASLPIGLTPMLRAAEGAQGVVYALLLSDAEEMRRTQLGYLAGHADARVHAAAQAAMPLIEHIGPAVRIPIVDMVLPTLRQMTAEKYEEFRTNVFYLASADMEINLFEYTLMRILTRNLDSLFRGFKRPLVQYSDVKNVTDQCVIVLSTLARFGNTGESEAVQAFKNGMESLISGSQAAILSEAQSSLEALDKALDALALASAPLKKRIINACAACVAADGQVTIEEGELLRAVADSLDCPMPPFVHPAAVAA